MRLRTRHWLILVLAIALFALVVPAAAQDEGGGEGEGGEGEGGEGEGGEGEGGEMGEPDDGDGEPQPGDDDWVPAADRPFQRPEVGAQVWSREFHPVYKLTYGQDQDVVEWRHDFDMAYPLTQKLRFTATTRIRTRDNEVLSRENRNENWNAGLDIALTPAIRTGVRYTRTVQRDVRNQGLPNEVTSFRERDNFDLTANYSKTYLSGINLKLGATTGIEKNHYSDIRSSGSRQTVNAGVGYQVFPGLTTDFDYSGSHSLLDANQAGVQSTDESFAHNLGGRIRYEWSAHIINADLRRAYSESQYPKNQETETRDFTSDGAAVDATIMLMENLETRLAYSYDRTKNFYAIEATKDSDLATRGVTAKLAYLLSEARFAIDLKSEKKRNNYFDFQTGDVFTNSVSANYTHAVSERLDLEARARMSLLSLHYDDIVANDQDRDLYDRELTARAEYKPKDALTTGLTVRIRDDQLIYIRTSRTGDNKQTQTYSVQPYIRYLFSPKVAVRQRYELSADYTFYTYDPDSNFLIRSFSVTTGLDWEPMMGLNLQLNHTYRGQDEGSYTPDEDGVERYGRNSERDDNRVDITLRYRVFGIIGFEVRQEFSVQKRYRYDEGEKFLSSEKYDTSITGRAVADHTWESGTALSFSVARTHRDATNIVERQREVWDIVVELSKTF
jgi:opacity protein-like surface antigen